jgi:hypothetical protein
MQVQRVAPMGPPHAAQRAMRASTCGVQWATGPAHRASEHLRGAIADRTRAEGLLHGLCNDRIEVLELREPGSALVPERAPQRIELGG